MDDINLHNESFYGDKLPVNIPSPDEAWNDMHERLKKEKKHGNLWWIGSFLTIGLLLLSLFIVNILKQHNAVNNRSSKNINHKKTGETNNIRKDVSGDYLQYDSGKSAAAKDIKIFSGKTPARNHPLVGYKPEVSYGDKGVVSFYRNKKKARLKGRSREKFSGGDVKDMTSTDDEANVVSGINNLLPEQQQADSPERKKDSKDTTTNDISKKPSLKTKSLTADSSNEDSDKQKTQDEEKEYMTDAGLQWNAQVPFANASGFFSGPNGNSQPYRLLLPGIWIDVRAGRSLLMIEVNPFSAVLLPSKPFNISTSSTMSSDTSITTSEIKKLNKLFGFSAGLGYAYNVEGNWWLGGRLQAIWWNKGLATSRVDISKQSLSGSFNTINTHSYNKYSLAGTEWEDFGKFQTKIDAEILYRKKIWQAGLHAGIPLMPFAKSAGPSSPFSAELFFRLQILPIRKNN